MFAAAALNVTLGFKLHQNLLQKCDGKISFCSNFAHLKQRTISRLR
jgi:hypothetical protein